MTSRWIARTDISVWDIENEIKRERGKEKEREKVRDGENE